MKKNELICRLQFNLSSFIEPQVDISDRTFYKKDHDDDLEQSLLPGDYEEELVLSPSIWELALSISDILFGDVPDEDIRFLTDFDVPSRNTDGMLEILFYEQSESLAEDEESLSKEMKKKCFVELRYKDCPIAEEKERYSVSEIV